MMGATQQTLAAQVRPRDGAGVAAQVSRPPLCMREAHFTEFS